MITGIGIDIVEIDRICKAAERQTRFFERILCETERTRYLQLKGRRKVEFLAGRYAAKEAFSKAAGTGIGSELSFQDIEIGKDEKGRPFITKPFTEGVHLSLSHSEHYAVAQVIIEKNNF